MTRTDYVCSDSEDEVTKGCLAKGYFQGWTRVVEVDLRGRPKIVVTRAIPQRVTLGMGLGIRLRLELRYIRVRPS